MSRTSDFFAKLARYADREPPAGVGGRLALLLRMTARAARSGRRLLAFDRPPIVIGGCGRSGTTLLLSILSAHPHVFAIPIETLALCATGYRAEPDLDAPLDLRKLYRILLLHEIPATCRRWCEKTPKNVRFFGPILDRFDDRVRLVHLVRDGRDVVTSRHPTDPDRYWVSPRRWTEDVEAGRRFEDHPRVTTVRYEDVVGSPEPTLRALCHFLGEEWDDRLGHWHEHATVRRNAAWFGGVQPLHRGSVARWQRPEHRRVVEELMADERAVALLRHYRYL